MFSGAVGSIEGVMLLKHVRIALAVAGLLATTAAPVLAAGSIGGGLYAGGGNGQSTTGAAILIGTSAGVPVVPVSVGATAFAPLARGGGYALTLDGTLAYGKDAFGAGYGIGQFGGARAGGTLTAFYDHQLAPFTTLELRGYKTVAAGGGSAAFLGVKFSL